MTLAALDQHKAVLCEKPMAMNSDESAKMVEAAKRANVLALIDHELRFLKSRKMMRSMLHTGAIGMVRHCNYVFRSDYRGLLDRPWDWWSDKEMGGGTLTIGSHVIDTFRWILGAEISEVCALLSTHISERPHKPSESMRAVTSDDDAKLMFRFAHSTLTKNSTATASLSVVESGSPQNGLEIYGTTGSLKVEETGELWHSPVGSSAWRPCQVHQEPVAPGMRQASWSRAFSTFHVRSSKRYEAEVKRLMALLLSLTVTSSNLCLMPRGDQMKTDPGPGSNRCFVSLVTPLVHRSRSSYLTIFHLQHE